jgi:hypothetical protein
MSETTRTFASVISLKLQNVSLSCSQTPTSYERLQDNCQLLFSGLIHRPMLYAVISPLPNKSICIF